MDPNDFPSFAAAAALGMEFELQEKDILYLPNRWFHSVVNLSPSLMVRRTAPHARANAASLMSASDGEPASARGVSR